MKTTPFLIRASICCALAMIPLHELENRIYSARMELRGAPSEPPKVVILDVDPHTLYNAAAYHELQLRLQAASPRAIVNAAAQSAHPLGSGLLQDSDGVIRRSAVLPREPGREGAAEPSLAYFAWLQREQAGGESQAARLALKKFTQPHWINYAGPAGTIPRCRIPRSIEANCPSLQDRVLILTDERESAPYFRTPLGEMSSTEIIANDLHTVVNHHPIYYASFTEMALFIIAVVLLSAFYIIYYPVLTSALALSGIGIVLTTLLFQLIFYLFDVYVPSANLISGFFVTYLVFTGYRLAFQDNLQWRALKQAQYLRELDQMKSNFLSLVSHDLKTPIAKIQAVTERFRREHGLPEAERSDWRELLDSIENSNNELKHFIMSVLNLSRIESQKVILNKRSNDINQLIQQALKRLKPLAEQKNLFIEENLEPLFSIECDEELMRQVLSNILDNAVKYSPVNAKIIVRSREEEGYVRVDVEDFGPGIPKDQLPLMFRKFSRFLTPAKPGMPKEQVKGSGLGLYLSKYFIELHGGKIGLKTVEGQGTVFTVHLPLTSENS